MEVAVTVITLAMSNASPGITTFRVVTPSSPAGTASASEAAERLRRREEFVVRFIERVLREAPSVGENILREMRQELEELAESSKVGGT
jgi:hypothetical protein